MVKLIGKIGIILSLIGGIMLIISGVIALFSDSELAGVLGQASATHNYDFALIFNIIIKFIPIGCGCGFIAGINAAVKENKIDGIIGMIFALVAIIGGFIPIALSGSITRTVPLCGSVIFHIMFGDFWLNYDAIIMILGILLGTTVAFKD